MVWNQSEQTECGAFSQTSLKNSDLYNGGKITKDGLRSLLQRVALREILSYTTFAWSFSFQTNVRAVDASRCGGQEDERNDARMEIKSELEVSEWWPLVIPTPTLVHAHTHLTYSLSLPPDSPTPMSVFFGWNGIKALGFKPTLWVCISFCDHVLFIRSLSI